MWLRAGLAYATGEFWLASCGRQTPFEVTNSVPMPNPSPTALLSALRLAWRSLYCAIPLMWGAVACSEGPEAGSRPMAAPAAAGEVSPAEVTLVRELIEVSTPLKETVTSDVTDQRFIRRLELIAELSSKDFQNGSGQLGRVGLRQSRRFAAHCLLKSRRSAFVGSCPSGGGAKPIVHGSSFPNCLIGGPPRAAALCARS